MSYNSFDGPLAWIDLAQDCRLLFPDPRGRTIRASAAVRTVRVAVIVIP
jgi:hypothetical protein